MQSMVLVVYNVRSAHNVGSILRTADGLGVNEVYLSGYTPYPDSDTDTRLPHEAAKTDRQIHKTALGAENSVIWHHESDIKKLLDRLVARNYKLVALEQTNQAVDIKQFRPVEKVALVVGSEIGGLPEAVLIKCPTHVHIPMAGQKESFNVAIAAAIALYHLLYIA